MNPVLRGATIGALALAVLGLVAAPASAAPTPRTLPDGAALYAINCEDRNLQLYNIDVATALATAVGTPVDVNGTDCAGQGAWDPVGKKAYYVAWGDPEFLGQVDLTTGITTNMGTLTRGEDTPDVPAIAIGLDGRAFAFSQTGTGYELDHLDLSTGALTPIATLILDGAPFSKATYPGAFSVDPVSGQFYVLDSSGHMFTLNTETAEMTAVATLDLSDGSGPARDVTHPYTMGIDLNGSIWIENDGTDADLWSTTLADPVNSVQFVGVISRSVSGAAPTEFYTESFILLPGTPAAPATTPSPSTSAAPIAAPAAVPVVSKPRLAETGADDTSSTLLLSGGALALFAGAALVVLRRRAGRAIR